MAKAQQMFNIAKIARNNGLKVVECRVLPFCEVKNESCFAIVCEDRYIHIRDNGDVAVHGIEFSGKSFVVSEDCSVYSSEEFEISLK